MSDTVNVKVLRPHMSPDGVHRRAGSSYERDRGDATELRGNGIVEISEREASLLVGKAEPAPQNKAEPALANKSAPAPARATNGNK